MSLFSLCKSADESDMAEDKKKRNHSKTLSVLLYIVHLLPLACKSEEILEYIFLPEDRTEGWEASRNFHADFPLNGWNDHIIQPARDAVLDYYKVRTLYLTYTVLAYVFNIEPYLFSESVLRRTIRRRGVHAPE